MLETAKNMRYVFEDRVPLMTRGTRVHPNNVLTIDFTRRERPLRVD